MINIDDLIGKNVVVNSLSLDDDNESATIFSVVGNLRHSYKERFFDE